MERRDFLKAMGAVGVAATMRNDARAEVPERPIKEPGEPLQVVLIVGESVRRDMLNCYRNTGLKTPNLDRLAAGGIRFERAYNCQPVCAPARSAIWTGLYPHTNGVWGNSMPLGDTTHTIAQRLTDHGTHCALIGKWHLSGTDYFDTGIPQPGWDPEYWYDMRNYLTELSIEDRRRSRDPMTANDPTWSRKMCFGNRVATRAVDFLSKHRGQTFFLAVAFDEPHDPSLCPVDYSEMYRDFKFPTDQNAHDSLENKPKDQQIWAGSLGPRSGWPIGSKQFFGANTLIDDEIGRILDEIERSAPNALVVYTSDHGVFLDSHRLRDKGPAMYDEITRIPFIVRWPGVAPANTVSDSLISHVDLAATLMELFGYEVPKTLEGCSMLAAWKDRTAVVRKDVFMEWGRYEVDHDGFGGFQPIRCICDGHHKLVVNLMVGDELYDLQHDPGELNNLIESPDHAELRNAMHDRLLDWMNTSRDPMRGYYWGRRKWRPEYPEKWDDAGMTRQREDDGYLPRELDYQTGLTMVRATRPK
jgi:uncharacterized sulfatase